MKSVCQKEGMRKVKAGINGSSSEPHQPNQPAPFDNSNPAIISHSQESIRTSSDNGSYAEHAQAGSLQPPSYASNTIRITAQHPSGNSCSPSSPSLHELEAAIQNNIYHHQQQEQQLQNDHFQRIQQRKSSQKKPQKKTVQQLRVGEVPQKLGVHLPQDG
ncbi:hypothetical protein Nepgr_021106 [Nepenthes gracilis]|uniref:Uncharacterized protein n=1 Tax=Nepenthes gracilis TaxID=150966 RepID=A0AAD3SWN5_NEPGR|nr:hypothetical protein Nepgr_021106 [Nepenthes gracilis]